MSAPDENMRNQIQAFADMYCEEGDDENERAFILLCKVAGHVLLQYHERTPADIEDPDSFTPQTLGGVPYGWSLVQGLTENLEMDFPDDEFRKMLP